MADYFQVTLAPITSKGHRLVHFCYTLFVLLCTMCMFVYSILSTIRRVFVWYSRHHVPLLLKAATFHFGIFEGCFV